MKNWSLLAYVLAAGFCVPALAQECAPTPEMNAVAIGSQNGDDFPSVAANQSFYQVLENGWTFALLKDPSGWSIRLFDSADVGNSTDLTSLTPPHGGAPNARDLFGWHFRNAANTGPNEGDVNAPQHIRVFAISPAQAGTGGYKPSTDPNELRFEEAGPDDGIGWLRIENMGLGNLNPGETATMNFLEFAACLSWPKSEAEQMAEADAARFDFNVLDTGLFTGCGLDFAAYELNAQWLPRRKSIDIDGDGTTDVVAQIVRRSDGARGLALCRNANFVHIVGFTTGDAGPDLHGDYVGQTEEWQWVTGPSDTPRHLMDRQLPQGDGGLLVLERVEKEAVALFWHDGALDSRQLYRYVEP